MGREAKRRNFEVLVVGAGHAGCEAAIAAATRAVRARGAVPLLLGGDDSVPIPFIEGFDDLGASALTILQVDAHIDWRDEVGGVQLRGGPLDDAVARASQRAGGRRNL